MGEETEREYDEIGSVQTPGLPVAFPRLPPFFIGTLPITFPFVQGMILFLQPQPQPHAGRVGPTDHLQDLKSPLDVTP